MGLFQTPKLENIFFFYYLFQLDLNNEKIKQKKYFSLSGVLDCLVTQISNIDYPNN